MIGDISIVCNLYGTGEYNCHDCDRCDEVFGSEE